MEAPSVESVAVDTDESSERCIESVLTEGELRSTSKADVDKSLEVNNATETQRTKQFLIHNSTVIIQPVCPISQGSTEVSSVTGDQDEEVVSTSENVKNSSTKPINSTSVLSCEVDFTARRSLLHYKCTECGRECPSKHKLKRHLSTHSDARPFPCKICGRTFKWSEYLQKHMRQQHFLGKGLVSQEAKSSVFVGKGKHVHSNKPKCVTINGQCITNRVVVKSQEFLATGETDKCDGRTQEESIGDDVGDAISHEMDGCNETQEQSDHLPLKRNAGVGVDMDAEDEQNSLSEISNLSMQKASENVCSSLICEGGYNGQCTMVPRSEVYDATYNSTNSIDARSCNLQSTSLKETYQLCPTDSSGTRSELCQNHSPSVDPSSTYLEAVSGVSKLTCNILPQSNMDIRSNFSEPVLGSSLLHQYNGDGLPVHFGMDSISMNCESLSSSSTSCSPDLISTTNIPHSTFLVTTTGDLGIQDSHLSSSQYYPIDSTVQSGYDEVQQLSCPCLSNSVETVSAQLHSCNSAIPVYVGIPPLCDNSQSTNGYESLDCNYRSLPHADYNVTQVNGYHVASNADQLIDNRDHFTSHHYHIGSGYQCSTSSTNNFVQDLSNSESPHLMQQQVQPDMIPSDETMKIKCVVKNSSSTKVDVGIQCEVGPETLQALFQDEDSESVKEVEEQSQTSNCIRVSSSLSCSDLLDDRLVQKFPCKVKTCNKAYRHRKDVIRHMRIRHGITPQKLEAIVVETPEKPHVCGIGYCKRSYFHMKDLRRHQRVSHKVNLNATTSADEEMCLETNDLLDDKTQMRYPCDFKSCLRSYVHKKDLVRHKRLYHKDPSSKPSIPVPIRYTTTELKQIRQKVKQEIDTKEQKMRLDSTGSNISVANSIDEESSESVCLNSVEINESTDCTILLSSSSSLQEVKNNPRLDITSDVASILSALEQHGSQFFGTNH